MARDEARLLCSLWTNDDFRARSPEAQRMYMLVISQSTLSHAGVAPLTVRRWAALADGTSVEDVRAALAELEAARFVVVDEDTEEVLVRSYVRNDRVLSNPNVAVAAVRAYRQVASVKLRRAWLVELRRLADERQTGGQVPKAWTDARSAALLAQVLTEPVPDPVPNPPPSTPTGHGEPLPEPLSVGGSGRGTEGGSSEPRTEGGAHRVRATRAAPAPTPAPTPHSVKGRENAPEAATTDVLIGEWIEHCRKRPPGNVIGQVAKQIKNMLGEGIDVEDVRRGLAAWHAKGLHPSTLPSLVNEAMNAAPRLKVVGGHQPYRNPTDMSAYEGQL